ncbi:glycosyltransferase family 4 protein [Halomicrobium katesii]|uniref:glycosyltransferase family 4 protein n=1 Tax=Halomicrobium katesii TaxID=437163 RepID=UPI0009B5AD85|nr:glycosyltransferase family 1 protein [Halomicrobium katesii]
MRIYLLEYGPQFPAHDRTDSSTDRQIENYFIEARVLTNGLSRLMNVAINTLSHVAGGSITYLKNVLPQLADDGNEYLVFVPDDRDALTEPDAENITFVSVTFPVGSLLLRLFYEQFVFPLVLLTNDIDVLFSPADITTLLSPCPVVLAIRNPNPYIDVPGIDRSRSQRLKLWFHRQLARLSAKRATDVFFVSEFSRDVILPEIGIDESKSHVIYHGIDASLFTDSADISDAALAAEVSRLEPYILCISTINEHKNYEQLLRGYARLPTSIRESYPLVIAGRNSAPAYFETLQSIIREEQIADDVHFLGEVEYEAIPALYDSGAVYVLPSKLETFGHTLVEAMASGTPIIAADSTCIPEITDGAAMLFDPDDASSLADSIVTLLGDDEARRSLVDAGRERVEDFSWNRTVSQTRELFSNANSTS